MTERKKNNYDVTESKNYDVIIVMSQDIANTFLYWWKFIKPNFLLGQSIIPFSPFLFYLYTSKYFIFLRAQFYEANFNHGFHLYIYINIFIQIFTKVSF